MIVVDVNSEDLLVIKPRNLKEMGDIAHQLEIVTFQHNLQILKC